jgi:hypothetical protein
MLLMLERMRQIDFMSVWKRPTLRQYGRKLRFVQSFEARFQGRVLRPTTLVRPLDSPAIPLVWSELYYSLREHKGRDGEVRPIKFASVRPIRSAVAHFYTMDMQSAYPPRRVMHDHHRRGMVMDYVSPSDELYCSFGAIGMATRMGTEVKKSWALSHVHISYIERESEKLYTGALCVF